MKKKIPVITVDGPSGSGKGTLAQALADKLKWHYLDSGAIYRAAASATLKANLLPSESSDYVNFIAKLDIRFRVDGNKVSVLCDGEDVSDQIRTEACAMMASKLAAISGVREALLALQKRFKQAPGLVTDGRDMGTRVFPDADFKVFLLASAAVRAQRRYKQLKEKGKDVSLRTIKADIEARDARDSERRASPLKAPIDAFVLDSSEADAAQVLAIVWARLPALIK